MSEEDKSTLPALSDLAPGDDVPTAGADASRPRPTPKNPELEALADRITQSMVKSINYHTREEGGLINNEPATDTDEPTD